MGLGAGVLLNVPPNRSGLIDETDRQRLREFSRERGARFGTPIRATRHGVSEV